MKVIIINFKINFSNSLKQESSSLNSQQQTLKRGEDDDNLENKCNKDVLDLKTNNNKRFKSNDGYVQNEQLNSNKASKDLSFLDNGRSYPCPECHKTFATEVDLKMHLLRHVMQHPFSCSTCGKGFKYEHTLAFHEKQHGLDSNNKLNLKNSNKKISNSNNQQQQQQQQQQNNHNHHQQQQRNDLLDEKSLVGNNRKQKYSSSTSSSSSKQQLHLHHLDDEDDHIPNSLLISSNSSLSSKLNNNLITSNSKSTQNTSSSIFSSSSSSNNSSTAAFDFGFPNSMPNLGIQMKSEKVSNYDYAYITSF